MPIGSYSLPTKLIQSIRDAVDLHYAAESYSQFVEHACTYFLDHFTEISDSKRQSISTQKALIISLEGKTYYVKNR
jgi:hypothetical protein